MQACRNLTEQDVRSFQADRLQVQQRIAHGGRSAKQSNQLTSRHFFPISLSIWTWRSPVATLVIRPESG